MILWNILHLNASARSISLNIMHFIYSLANNCQMKSLQHWTSILNLSPPIEPGGGPLCGGPWPGCGPCICWCWGKPGGPWGPWCIPIEHILNSLISNAIEDSTLPLLGLCAVVHKFFFFYSIIFIAFIYRLLDHAHWESTIKAFESKMFQRKLINLESFVT